MVLTIDVGNSSIKFGTFDGRKLLGKFSISTKKDATVEDFDLALRDFMPLGVSSIIASSVVPEIEKSLAEYFRSRLKKEVVFVKNDFKSGLEINYEPLESVGTDRLVVAFAGVEKYGKPCIVCDFGTATTIDAVSPQGVYMGGIITPGIATMAEALHLKTSKLPRLEISQPRYAIGNSTVTSIQSGIFYGYLGLTEGLISRIKGEFPNGANPKVIATGGNAGELAKNTTLIDIVDENLMLEGLALIALNSLV